MSIAQTFIFIPNLLLYFTKVITMHNIWMWKPPKPLAQPSSFQRSSSACSPSSSHSKPTVHALPPKPPLVPAYFFSGNTALSNSVPPKSKGRDSSRLSLLELDRNSTPQTLFDNDDSRGSTLGGDLPLFQPDGSAAFEQHLPEYEEEQGYITVTYPDSPDGLCYPMHSDLSVKSTRHLSPAHGNEDATDKMNSSAMIENDLSLPQSCSTDHNEAYVQNYHSLDPALLEVGGGQDTGINDLAMTQLGNSSKLSPGAALPGGHPANGISEEGSYVPHFGDTAAEKFPEENSLDDSCKSTQSMSLANHDPRSRKSTPRELATKQTTTQRSVVPWPSTRKRREYVNFPVDIGRDPNRGHPGDRDDLLTISSVEDAIGIPQSSTGVKNGLQPHKRRTLTGPCQRVQPHGCRLHTNDLATTRPNFPNFPSNRCGMKSLRGSFQHSKTGSPEPLLTRYKNIVADESDSDFTQQQEDYMPHPLPREDRIKIPMEAYWERSANAFGFSCSVRWFTDPEGIPIPRTEGFSDNPLSNCTHLPESRQRSRESDLGSGTRNQRRGFTFEEDELLVELRGRGLSWSQLTKIFQEFFPHRTQSTLQGRWSKHLQYGLGAPRSHRK
jgi:hypothetical protein